MGAGALARHLINGVPLPRRRIDALDSAFAFRDRARQGSTLILLAVARDDDGLDGWLGPLPSHRQDSSAICVDDASNCPSDIVLGHLLIPQHVAGYVVASISNVRIGLVASSAMVAKDTVFIE